VSNDGFRSIKIRVETHEKLRKLIGRIALGGWSGVGIDSDAPVSIWNTIDAALDALAKQKKERK
jgi:hypothetical protein